MKNETKRFKDPLYNYIVVDADICSSIIDSKYFQRLRRIEQTSMRCLYPSARHDRFIHSLGTYHLAKIAIKSINENGIIFVNGGEAQIDKARFIPSENERNILQFSFEMAALLHDIGHSPFSHTLEEYFKTLYYKELDDIKEKDILSIFLDEMKKLQTDIGDIEEDFINFSADCKTSKAAPHEIVSCIIIIRCFKPILDKLASDRNLVIKYCFLTRCILGAIYSDDNLENCYKNCIIKLLNSSIDVDKLDYISRDSQVSGYDNTMVDTIRLLNSLIITMFKGTNNSYSLCLAFKKTALGVIQNVITSRNAMYTWIYSHHKVKYESYLINNAIKLISEREENPKLFISKYFSVKNIEEHLVCDDSIWNLFMQNISLPQVNELIQRSTQKVAVWKSFAEFEAYFNNDNTSISVGDFSAEQMREYLKNNDVSDFESYLNEFSQDFNFVTVINSAKLSNIEHNSILIYINNGLYAFDNIFKDLYKESKFPIFFYIYCSREDKDKLNKDNYKLKNELIGYIKKFDGFKLEPK
ncbi:hypothetical protein B5G26_13905 [Anaerotignum lactatifermentans]|jgi:uncharacterized protein|uniref:HD domain-containing protein n=1 Tax=Anaerotignum lactatifermentans TaxID=160404 RepID=A0A1Y3TWG2_9FIRM|nr:HD domain-containing protein [Anaerotignum lactatifermentans]OUN40801.1 hypothetical protein B5G26_13905 [Anaerotignum lactatifermentans]